MGNRPSPPTHSKPNPSPPYIIPAPPAPCDSSVHISPANNIKNMGIITPFSNVDVTAAPAPSYLFSPQLRNPPVPTNTFWQNFVLKNGDQPEYIHPYMIKSSNGSLTISYPKRAVNSAFIFQAFIADLIVSCVGGGEGNHHTVDGYDDLSVTLGLPGPMVVPLARGSPYITVIIKGGKLNISTIHAVLGFDANSDKTKHRITMNNSQVWVIYSSKPLDLAKDLSVSGNYEGVIRIALLSDDPSSTDDALSHREDTLDKYSSIYPVSGSASLRSHQTVVYKWDTNSWGKDGNVGPLMLAHPLQRSLLVKPELKHELSYKSLDGDLVGVVGKKWVLQDSTQVPVSWHSNHGFQEGFDKDKMVSSLKHDVANLTKIITTSSYFYGKAIARAARFAMIAEEVGCSEVLPQIKDFLTNSINPWLDGSFEGNALVYDQTWGGLISSNGAKDTGADFGLGVYNDHHFHFGYFCYAMAVLAKLDPIWARKYRTHAYAIVLDYMTQDSKKSGKYPRVRSFDFWKLHSWASGITEFADGRNQESTSEAINGYYSAGLLGLAYGDSKLMSTASTLLGLEIRAAQMFWHVPANSTLYDPEFVDENRVVGVLWSTKRDSGLWFAPKEYKEMRTGIQVLPILPVTESLFCDAGFVKELVEWTLPALQREGVTDGWRGFVYALQSIYHRDESLAKVLALKEHDDGNSLTNLLWWIYTRPKSEYDSSAEAKYCKICKHIASYQVLKPIFQNRDSYRQNTVHGRKYLIFIAPVHEKNCEYAVSCETTKHCAIFIVLPL